MITEESARLRAALRDGDMARGIPATIHCECRRRAAAKNVKLELNVVFHLPDCAWTAAVQRIYALERAAEAASNNPNEETHDQLQERVGS